MLAGAAAAQDVQQSAPSAPAVEDTQALIRRMEQRLQALDQSTKQRDDALRFLERQVDAAQGAINGGQEAQSALREGAAALSTRLDDVAKEREQLSTDVEFPARPRSKVSRGRWRS